MRRAAPRPLEAALGGLLGDLRPATTLARVQAVWPRVVGEALAAEAEPVSERSGKVTVRCSSSVWAQELDLLSGDLLDRLNTALATEVEQAPVESLRFVAAGRGAVR